VTPTEARVHDSRLPTRRRIPCPRGSRLLQDLGFLAFTLPQVEILMPPRNPVARKLPLEEKLANGPALSPVTIEHVNSSVKRCRIVKDRIRLWKEGWSAILGDGNSAVRCITSGASGPVATNG